MDITKATAGHVFVESVLAAVVLYAFVVGYIVLPISFKLASLEEGVHIGVLEPRNRKLTNTLLVNSLVQSYRVFVFSPWQGKLRISEAAGTRDSIWKVCRCGILYGEFITDKLFT